MKATVDPIECFQGRCSVSFYVFSLTITSTWLDLVKKNYDLYQIRPFSHHQPHIRKKVTLSFALCPAAADSAVTCLKILHILHVLTVSQRLPMQTRIILSP